MTGTVLTGASGASARACARASVGGSRGAVRGLAVVVRALGALAVPAVAVAVMAVTGVGSSRLAPASHPAVSPLVVGHSSAFRPGASGPAVLDPALAGRLGPAWSGTVRPARSGSVHLDRTARDSGCCSAPIAFTPEWPVAVG